MALLREGFQYWFDQGETEVLNSHNEQFEAVSMEEELILTYYRVPEKGEQGIFVTVTDILTKIGMYLKNPLSSQKVGIVMKKLGFEKITRGHNKQRGYIVIEYTMEQVIANRRLTRNPDATEQSLPF
jgi:predicted P-loop ATPase